jgi:hypothetical protein
MDIIVNPTHSAPAAVYVLSEVGLTVGLRDRAPIHALHSHNGILCVVDGHMLLMRPAADDLWRRRATRWLKAVVKVGPAWLVSASRARRDGCPGLCLFNRSYGSARRAIDRVQTLADEKPQWRMISLRRGTDLITSIEREGLDRDDLTFACKGGSLAS